jgi:hypothetical protein
MREKDEINAEFEKINEIYFDDVSRYSYNQHERKEMTDRIVIEILLDIRQLLLDNEHRNTCSDIFVGKDII